MTRRWISTSLATAVGLLILAAPALARAGGYEVVQQSAVAGGTGSASTARDKDPAAAWFNPAALADEGGLRTSLGITLAMAQLHAEALPAAQDGPWEASTDTGVSPPPHLYASYARGSWAAGVSVNVPFASGVTWPEEWSQRFDVISSEIQFLRISPFFAWRFGPVRIAAGPQVDIGRVYLKRATNHIEQEGSSAIVLSGHGFGGQAAVFAKLGENVSLGLSYKSRSLSPMSGDADFTVPEVFAPDYPDQHISADWTVPDRFALGGAFTMGGIRALMDLTLTLWSTRGTLPIHFEDPATDDREIVSEWRNSMALRLGAEYTPIKWVTARAGFYADGLPKPPPPEEHLSPSSPDSTRVAATLGASAHLGSMFSIDIFYEHLRLLERESTSLDAPLAAYRGYANLVGFDLRLVVGGKKNKSR